MYETQNPANNAVHPTGTGWIHQLQQHPPLRPIHHSPIHLPQSSSSTIFQSIYYTQSPSIPDKTKYSDHIGQDKAHFQAEKVWHFSYFSTKTYVEALLMSTHNICFMEN